MLRRTVQKHLADFYRILNSIFVRIQYTVSFIQRLNSLLMARNRFFQLFVTILHRNWPSYQRHSNTLTVLMLLWLLLNCRKWSWLLILYISHLDRDLRHRQNSNCRPRLWLSLRHSSLRVPTNLTSTDDVAWLNQRGILRSHIQQFLWKSTKNA